MPVAVYLFTYHAYQSWMPDRKRGYVKDGKILPPDPEEAKRYRDRASQPPHLFTPDQEHVLLAGVYDICQRRGWRLHCLAVEVTHVHVLVSWRDFRDWREVRDKIKNLLSLFLGRDAGVAGRHWFSRKASRKRVKDRVHLTYLINEYLPKHGGLFWREGDAPPMAIDAMLPIKEMRASARGLDGDASDT